MCNKIQILNRTKNGILLYCNFNDIYHLLYNNLNFNFTAYEFESFCKYLNDTNVEFWENEYRHSLYHKRIPVPTIQANLLILIDQEEVKELKHLVLSKENAYPLLKVKDIDHKIFMN